MENFRFVFLRAFLNTVNFLNFNEFFYLYNSFSPSASLDENIARMRRINIKDFGARWNFSAVGAARTALGAQIISLNASPFRDPPSSAAQQSAAAIIATSFIPLQCARPRTRVTLRLQRSRRVARAKTNLPDKESSSPGRQKKKKKTRAQPRIYLNYTNPKRRDRTLCRKRCPSFVLGQTRNVSAG